MGYRLVDAVLLLALPGDEERVLLRLARHADNRTAECRLKVDTLAEEVARTPRAVQLALRKLERRGLVVVAAESGGAGLPRTYRVEVATGEADCTREGVKPDAGGVKPVAVKSGAGVKPDVVRGETGRRSPFSPPCPFPEPLPNPPLSPPSREPVRNRSGVRALPSAAPRRCRPG